MYRLDGKNAIVTGAGSGIGQAIARTFAAQGARVFALDLDEASAVMEFHAEVFGREVARLELAGEEATEERVVAELPRHRFVHLATHGYFEPEGLPSMWEQVVAEGDDGGRFVRMEMRPEERRLTGMLPGLLSGLVLAGANAAPEGDRDDGFLTAEEPLGAEAR